MVILTVGNILAQVDRELYSNEEIKNGKPIIFEVNTLPGMTSASLFPMNILHHFFNDNALFLAV